MSASDPMNPRKERLARDLAAQAGLVLRNVKLIEELRGSRQRLVAGQDGITSPIAMARMQALFGIGLSTCGPP